MSLVKRRSEQDLEEGRSTHPTAAVRVRGLRKSYGRVQAIAGIDLDVERGEIFALLGPNGAGKTSTIEILEGYRSRDGGEVSVLGFDPKSQRAALKRQIGIVLQSMGVERYLTVRETLTMYAQLYSRSRNIDEVAELVGLTHKRSERVVRLSGGQQRRLDVGIALVGDPDLLFLDEPTTGFDPSARREAWEVLKGLASLGKTVLLTTHFMDEAQYLADRVAVIADGQIVAQGPPSDLGMRGMSTAVIRYRLPNGVVAPSGVWRDGLVELESQEVASDLHEILHWAAGAGVELEHLEVRRPSLEEVYLDLTGGAGGEEVSWSHRRRRRR
ncbi:MAG: ABC transporter ATP-binding protein [Acidimicrobiales bacterium]